MRMSFGKYGPSKLNPRGVDLAFINSGYLYWLMKQNWFVMEFDEKIVVPVERELYERDRANSHFYDDKVNIY